MTADLVPSVAFTGEVVTADPTGGRLVAWASSLFAAKQIADALCETTFAPTQFRGKPNDAAAAILFGDEIGFTPTQALRSVHVINGNPGLYARAMVALVQSHGHTVETVEKTDAKVIVRGKRRGSSHWETEEWTTARAQKAGYTSNKKYATDPQSMLYARAAADICRRVAPDALAGLAYTVEEYELEDIPTTTVSRAPATKRTVKRIPVGEEPTLDETPQIEAAPSDAVEGITAAQVTKLSVGLNEAGFTDRALTLLFVAETIGRDVESRKDLTKDEASRVIDRLERMAAEKEEAATDQGDDGPAEPTLDDPWDGK